MPLEVTDTNSIKFPTPSFLTLSNWRKGVITLIDKSRLPKDALEEATNLFLAEDGNPTPRPGVDWYGVVSPNASAIDGFSYFDFNGAIHLVMVAGGTVYRSTDNGSTWTACTGFTLTAGVDTFFNQYNNFLYITNATDNITLYDGTTVLTQYTTLATPSAPTSAKTGLAGVTVSYYYKVSAVNTIGFTTASVKVTQTVDRLRDSWDSTANFVTLTMPATVATQTRFDIYISDDDLTYYYLDSVSVNSTTYKDDGSAIPNPAITAPTANTTQGPKVAELTNVGSRMYGVRDPVNRYRIWFSSGGAPFGAFASAYDGGYIDWQIGGKFLPVQVEDYRNGRGDPLATVWCKSADGQGCILQISLDTLTVGDVTITVPSAYKLPGSRGTPAPGSVVNVLNDYLFYNTQAFYNLGNRVNLQQIISTDEISANIRPSVKAVTTAGESNICSVYFDAKVYWSVSVGSTTNNQTIVYDTERKAWLPEAFTLGFKKFLRYTDTNSVQRLLTLKPGDNRLSEISSGIQGDYGVAFMTSLTTGLYPTDSNRFEFQFTEEAEIELSNPQGSISVELVGIERAQGFSTVKSQTITTVGTPYGWDSFLWDSTLWDDTTLVSDPFSESSVKRYFTVQKELNAVQWHLTTNSLDATYILRTLQTWGTVTTAGKPRQWRLV